MKGFISRAYFGSIFFEYALQDRLADAVIILPGFPSGNNLEDLIHVFYEKGYHVFVPRFRGSYQSTGIFLSKNPVDDMIDFVKHLEEGELKNLWDMKKQNFRINKKILIGTSFSGAIACGVAAKYPAFSHLILFAPVWDFEKHNAKGDEQDLEKITEFVKKAYKNCYRFSFKSIKRKLKKFEETKPGYYVSGLKKIPILIMHDPNDKSVSFANTKEMIPLLPKVTYLEHYFGHRMNTDVFLAYWKEIDKFVKINYVG